MKCVRIPKARLSALPSCVARMVKGKEIEIIIEVLGIDRYQIIDFTRESLDQQSGAFVDFL